MNSPNSPVSAELSSDSKRWLARFSGEFLALDNGTRMGASSHMGPLRVQRPFYPEGKECLHLYLLHPPGGLVGGDRLSIDLSVRRNAHLLMTTPSAGKLYRNISGLSQGQYVQLNIAAGGCLEYLPQENIVFDGAEGELHAQVDIEGDGLFVGWEITCLGRYESDDPFEQGRLRQSLLIYRDGQPLFMDRLLLEAPCQLQTSRAGFQGCSVFGSMVITRELMSDESFQESLIEWQQSLPVEISLAITQKPDVWIARALGDKAEKVRDAFEVLWEKLRPQLLNRPACPPRIWRT